jgi:hypothetical protein
VTVSTFNLMGAISIAAAAIGVVFYFLALLRPPRGARLVQSSGLLFTALALGEFATFGPRAASAGALFNVTLCQLFLIVAIIVQAWSGLRRRRTYEGIDRRGPTTLS